MKDSADRILTTHAGSLARPAELREMLTARDERRPYDPAAFASSVRDAVAEAVRRRVGHDAVKTDLANFTSALAGAVAAERLVKYARLVGRERVIAGTDCGPGPRVGHPKIAWAKFEALVEGARLATRELWR